MRFYDAFDKTVDQPRAAVIPITTPTGGTPYGRTALEREAENVATAPEGTRNHTLNRAAYSLAQLVAAGHLDQLEVHDTLRTAALNAGLQPGEIEATLRSGVRAGVQQPRIVPDKPIEPALTFNGRPPRPAAASTVVAKEEAAPSIVREHIDQQTGEITEQSVDFWQARPILTHVRDFAYARMTSPWAVLGVCLLRALAIVPPHVVLPALIGGHGSLNLFCALVGPSGVGKGAAEAAAADAIRMPHTIYTATVGSGEGIAHQYAHREKGSIVTDRQAVLFSVPEVDTLTALGNRQGSTLLSQLRSAFSGERLGFGYADAMKRIPIERHEYRLGMTVGVQPEKAGPILDDADGGTPQRFIWLPATDPHISPTPADEPEPWQLPPTNWNETMPRRGGRNIFPIPAPVADHIRQQHAARARGEGEALDGHALFAREKVAAALAVLDHRTYIDDDDWQLSGAVMRVSDLTRTRVRETLNATLARSEQARTRVTAERAAAASEAVVDAAVQRVCRSIIRTLHTGSEPMPWSTVRKHLPGRDREHFEDAIGRLIEAGQIAIEGDESSRKIKAV